MLGACIISSRPRHIPLSHTQCITQHSRPSCAAASRRRCRTWAAVGRCCGSGEVHSEMSCTTDCMAAGERVGWCRQLRTGNDTIGGAPSLPTCCISC